MPKVKVHLNRQWHFLGLAISKVNIKWHFFLFSIFFSYFFPFPFTNSVPICNTMKGLEPDYPLPPAPSTPPEPAPPDPSLMTSARDPRRLYGHQGADGVRRLVKASTMPAGGSHTSLEDITCNYWFRIFLYLPSCWIPFLGDRSLFTLSIPLGSLFGADVIWTLDERKMMSSHKFVVLIEQSLCRKCLLKLDKLINWEHKSWFYEFFFFIAQTSRNVEKKFNQTLELWSKQFNFYIRSILESCEID